MTRRTTFLAAVTCWACAVPAAWGQAWPEDEVQTTRVPVVASDDVVWRYAASLGGTKTTGNSRSSSINLTGEAVRTTDYSKLNLAGRALYAESDDKTSGANVTLNVQYDRDFSLRWFGFGRLDLMRDRPANINLRESAYGGLGYHLLLGEDSSWDLTGGFGYTEDSYVVATNVGGDLRQRYGRVEMVMAQTSNHKLTDSTTLRQKLGIYPNLRDGGEYRLVFDAGLSVAINSSLSLTAGVIYRYDSDPGTGLKRGDAVYVTGIGIKFD